MSYKETSYLNEEERKKHQKKSEEELKREQELILKMEKTKEIIREEENISNDLQTLKDLLEKHIIDDTLVEKVLSKTEINHEDIQEIFEKIDAIEDIDGIDEYLSKDMRVTKDEYLKATQDEEEYSKVTIKIHNALSVLAQHINPQQSWWVNIFSGFLLMLDKNLVTIQEHHIDMKDSLEARRSKNTLTDSIWQTIKKSFR